MRILIIAALAAVAACDSPPATQPEDFETANGTLTDQPVAPGALGEGAGGGANAIDANVSAADQNAIGADAEPGEQPGVNAQ